jgi:hypothetical protein
MGLEKGQFLGPWKPTWLAGEFSHDFGPSVYAEGLNETDSQPRTATVMKRLGGT